jgi:hypothetical protein
MALNGGDFHEHIHYGDDLIHQRVHHQQVLGTLVAHERRYLCCLVHHRVRHLRLSALGRLVEFYNGDRTRILIAAVLWGNAVLFLLWFAAALRTTLADAGQDGWGAAATASSAAVGGLFLLLIAVGAALAYAISGSGNQTLTSGLNDLAWAGVVLTSFPRAMLIMSGTFGLWRAGLISNALFAAGVAAVVLVLLGGTTWLSGGFWAPDGAYSRFVSPVIGLVWVVVVSRVLLTRSPATRAGW